MKKNIFKNMDWGVFICSVVLCSIGMIALFSATHESGYETLRGQAMWFIVSIPIVFIIIFIDYEHIAKISPIFYRSFHSIIISGSFHRASKWCKKLV